MYTRSIAMLMMGAAIAVTDLAAGEPDFAQRIAQNEPRGMRFDVYIRLKQGMSEAELLQRAGAPDYESIEGTDSRTQAIVQDGTVIDSPTGNRVPQKSVIRSERTAIVKSWYYLPTTTDPFTTHVTLIGGRIAEIERTKKF